MKIDTDDEGIDPSLTGEEYVRAVEEKKAARSAMPQMPQMPQMPESPDIPNPAIAQVRQQPTVSAARQEIERIKAEDERKKQEHEDAEELAQIKRSKQLEQDHPILVKTGRAIKTILGTTSEKISAGGDRFIQAQNASDKVLRKNSMQVPGTKKTAKRAPSEDDEIEDDESGGSSSAGIKSSMGSGSKKVFPFREFDSDSSLPKAAYLPKNQFGKEYKSVGVPVTLRMTGANNRPSDGMPGMQHGMPEMPMGKRGKRGSRGKDEEIMPLDNRMRSGGMGGIQPSDNSGMGEYRSPKIPVTLKGGVAMGDFRSLGVPNSLSGVTLGGLGAAPRISYPVMTKQTITMPSTLPLKKKVNK